MPSTAPSDTDPAPLEISGSDRLRGRFRARRTAEGAGAEPEAEEDDPLSAIGYSAGSQPAPALSGVTRHFPEAVSAGLNFFVSGHAPVAILMDMNGKVVHRWRAAFRDIWPNYPGADERADSKFWRRAHLFENGDVIAVFESMGIVKLDRDSNVLWARSMPVHHDLQIMENGNICTLTRKIIREEAAVETVRRLSSMRPQEGGNRRVSILEDFATVLSPEGVLKNSISIFKCFENSDPEHSWNQPAIDFWSVEDEREFTGSPRDIYHTNSIEVLDGGIAERIPAFAKGNLLISLRHLDMLAVIDPRQKQVVWSMTGASTLQHDAQITSDGNLLYFDNQWQQGKTRVAIVDPLTREIIWQYGTRPGQELYSETCGTVQELPNKNLLITETDNGRAIEVTRDGNVVWEFFNPNGVGDNDELIASLFEIVRLHPGFGAGWLSE